jgi:hypothetical protein
MQYQLQWLIIPKHSSYIELHLTSRGFHGAILPLTSDLTNSNRWLVVHKKTTERSTTSGKNMTPMIHNQNCWTTCFIELIKLSNELCQATRRIFQLVLAVTVCLAVHFPTPNFDRQVEEAEKATQMRNFSRNTTLMWKSLLCCFWQWISPDIVVSLH